MLPRSEAPVLCRVMHARQKGNYTVSKPYFAVQIIEMSVSFGFTLCALPRGAVGTPVDSSLACSLFPPSLELCKGRRVILDFDGNVTILSVKMTGSEKV